MPVTDKAVREIIRGQANCDFVPYQYPDLEAFHFSGKSCRDFNSAVQKNLVRSSRCLKNLSFNLDQVSSGQGNTPLNQKK